MAHINPPVDWRLQGTSSWANLATGRDRQVPPAWRGDGAMSPKAAAAARAAGSRRSCGPAASRSRPRCSRPTAPTPRRSAGSPPGCGERSTRPTAPTTRRPSRTSRRSPPARFVVAGGSRADRPADLPRPQPPGAAGGPPGRCRLSGARNVLLLTGDDVSAGDHPEAKPLFDSTRCTCCGSPGCSGTGDVPLGAGAVVAPHVSSSAPSRIPSRRRTTSGRSGSPRRSRRAPSSSRPRSASTCPRLREFMTRVAGPGPARARLHPRLGVRRALDARAAIPARGRPRASTCRTT